MFVYYVYDIRALLTPFFKELVIMKYYILCEFLVYHFSYVICELGLYIIYICLNVCILL